MRIISAELAGPWKPANVGEELSSHTRTLKVWCRIPLFQRLPAHRVILSAGERTLGGIFDISIHGKSVNGGSTIA